MKLENNQPQVENNDKNEANVDIKKEEGKNSICLSQIYENAIKFVMQIIARIKLYFLRFKKFVRSKFYKDANFANK